MLELRRYKKYTFPNKRDHKKVLHPGDKYQMLSKTRKNINHMEFAKSI
jgi:hypothetical protein